MVKGMVMMMIPIPSMMVPFPSPHDDSNNKMINTTRNQDNIYILRGGPVYMYMLPCYLVVHSISCHRQ